MIATFTANDSLEFSYTLNYVIKCANDLKILLSSCAEKWEEFPSAREYKSLRTKYYMIELQSIYMNSSNCIHPAVILDPLIEIYLLNLILISIRMVNELFLLLLRNFGITHY